MTDNWMWFYFGSTVFLSVLLSVAPLPFATPDWVAHMRPEWLILVWYFWLIFQSERCNLIVIFVIGLIVDVMLNEPLGLNSLLLISLQYVSLLGLRLLDQGVALRSTIMLFVLVLMATFIKSLVLLVAVDIELSFLALISPALATTVIWLPLIPLLNTESSQLTE